MRGRALCAIAFAALCAVTPARAADLAAEVDPMIGTFAPGFVFPGASVPFGMVQNSPDTIGSGFAYSGYLWSDPLVRGFSLVHLNGPGVKKAGDIGFMPTLGPASNQPARYASTYSHASERAEPGYYRVYLDLPQTRAELTASTRAAMQRYTFPPVTGAGAKLVMDTARSVEGTADATWRVTGPAEVAGSRQGRYPVFFVAQFDRPFKSHGAFAATGPGAGGWVAFDTLADRDVTVRIGISFVDEQGARNNLQAEAPDFDFEARRGRARAAWNAELARIGITGGAAFERRPFYSALFHAYQHPNVFTDVDGRYRGMDGATHVAEGYTQYANFSSWDTYKAQNQLLALTQPARYRDMLRSLLADAEQLGYLPRWGEQSIDASHMSGDPAIPMIVDGYCRGLLDDPLADALYAKALALRERRPASLAALGYLPDKPGTTLEYGVADFALALMAEGLGRDADAAALLSASLNYRNILDPATGWIRPRHADGTWLEPFDPTADDGFQEGNSWQYSWLAPHDARGLFDRMGGDAVVGERFDSFFGAPAIVQNQATFFGLVYRLPWYAPGNEHDIQAPWMPAALGRPWQVAQVHRNARTLFRPTPDGLPGNDDLGSLSAWHVFSALGFGPAIPGAPLHVVGSPQFERAVIDVGAGRTFTVSAPGNSLLTPYVQSARLGGAALERSWFDDAAVRAGGELELTMGSQRSPWATAPSAAAPSASTTPLAGFGCAYP